MPESMDHIVIKTVYSTLDIDNLRILRISVRVSKFPLFSGFPKVWGNRNDRISGNY